MKAVTHLLCTAQQKFSWSTAVVVMGLGVACMAIPDTASAAETPGEKPGGALDLTSCSKPVWPPEALAAKQTGTVTMALLIGSDGKVKQSRITKSSGYKDLDVATRDGIAKCSFRPGTLDGKPAEAWLMFQYVWTLD